MTVTINTLGTNSRQIVIANETSATNIINAVNTCLTSLGWTLVDTVTSGSRGCLTTKVYSAPNADTYTTKYMIIRYDLPRQYWYVSCCEAWNTVTHVATNESWSGDCQILLPLQYGLTNFYIFATARYALFLGTVRNEPSAWQGVFEFEREDADDIANHDIPCFGWTSSLTIGEPYGSVNTTLTDTAASTNNGFVACGFAPPRTRNGLTGYNAAANFTIMTVIGSYPPPKAQFGADFTSTGSITQTINSHTGMLGGWGDNQQYVYDANKVLISNVKLAGYTSTYVVGRIYGLKVCQKLGAVLDTTVVPVDANLFYDSAGSNLTHYFLGINGGYNDKLAVGSNRLLKETLNLGTTYGTVYQSVVVGGRYLYFTTSTGLYKYDLLNNTISGNLGGVTAQYYTLKFDGGNYLYYTGATSAYTWRLNLSDDSVVQIVPSTSIYTANRILGIDDDNIWLYQASGSATQTVRRWSLASLTETSVYTGITSGAGTQLFINSSVGTYNGEIFLGTLWEGQASSCRIIKINAATGSIMYLTPTANMYWITTSVQYNVSITHAQPTFSDNRYVYFVNCSAYTTTTNGRNNARIIKIDTTNFTITSLETAGASAYDPGVSPNWFSNSNLYTLGSAELMAFAGMRTLRGWTSNLEALNFTISDPRVQTLPAFPANKNNTFDTADIWSGYPCTDQCNLYAFSPSSNVNKIMRYYGAMRNYNFNGAQSANILVAQ